MRLDKHGKILSKKLTHLVKAGHAKRIVITDNRNNRVIHFPVMFFAVITILFPLAVGVLLFIFLLSEYHAVLED